MCPAGNWNTCTLLVEIQNGTLDEVTSKVLDEHVGCPFHIELFIDGYRKIFKLI